MSMLKVFYCKKIYENSMLFHINDMQKLSRLNTLMTFYGSQALDFKPKTMTCSYREFSFTVVTCCTSIHVYTGARTQVFSCRGILWLLPPVLFHLHTFLLNWYLHSDPTAKEQQTDEKLSGVTAFIWMWWSLRSYWRKKWSINLRYRRRRHSYMT